jgi:5'-3' exonuclease
LSQLISDDVRIYFCDLKNYVDKSNYFLYFSHHPENAALIKIIIGDNSDTIKGVKGVKETTLLSLFPEIKGIALPSLKTVDRKFSLIHS